MKKIGEKLQERWKLKSLTQVFLVLLVFALTGSSVLLLKKPLFAFLNLDNKLDGFLGTLIYLAIMLPLYQILLLCYGFVFGQFSFFWEFEKKSMRRVAGLFKRKKKSDSTEVSG
jgi:hypothetical protein